MPDNARTAAGAAGDQAGPGVDKTLTKGLQILEAIAEGEASRGVSELAAELSLTKSNVHRLIQTLVRAGYVVRDDRTERYALSSKLWQITRPQNHYAALRRLVRPALEQLVAVTSESATFAVVERDELIVVDQVDTPHTIRVFFSAEQTLQLDQVVLKGSGLTAFQKLIFSTWPEAMCSDAVTKIAKQLGRSKAYIKATLNEIARAHVDGYAISQGDWVANVKAVATPVFGRFDNLLGVLICFGPAERLDDARMRKTIKAACEKARELSAAIKDA